MVRIDHHDRGGGSGMKAIVQGRFGPPGDVLEPPEIEAPVPADDEVLVRIHSASIHIGDYYTIVGRPKVMRPVFSGLRAKNRVPGTDFAGTIQAVGDRVTSYEPGDEVFGSYKGAFAELAVAPVAAIAPKPADLSFEQASTLGVSAVTAPPIAAAALSRPAAAPIAGDGF